MKILEELKVDFEAGIAKIEAFFEGNAEKAETAVEGDLKAVEGEVGDAVEKAVGVTNNVGEGDQTPSSTESQTPAA